MSFLFCQIICILRVWFMYQISRKVTRIKLYACKYNINKGKRGVTLKKKSNFFEFKLFCSNCSKLSKKNSAKLERIWTTLTNGLTKLRKKSLAKKHFLKMNPALTIKSMECNILFKMWMITIVQVRVYNQFW